MLLLPCSNCLVCVRLTSGEAEAVRCDSADAGEVRNDTDEEEAEAHSGEEEEEEEAHRTWGTSGLCRSPERQRQPQYLTLNYHSRGDDDGDWAAAGADHEDAAEPR